MTLNPRLPNGNGGDSSGYYNRLLDDPQDRDVDHTHTNDNSGSVIDQISRTSMPLSHSQENRSGTEAANTCNEQTTLMTPPTEAEGGIVVVVLDMRQRKFRANASPDWTVAQVSCL